MHIKIITAAVITICIACPATKKSSLSHESKKLNERTDKSHTEYISKIIGKTFFSFRKENAVKNIRKQIKKLMGIR